MTITRSDKQARSHRIWTILLAIVALLTLGYYVYRHFIVVVPVPVAYGSVAVCLRADIPWACWANTKWHLSPPTIRSGGGDQPEASVPGGG